MSVFKQMNRDVEAKTYWEGKENKVIRLWVYTLRGLNMVNEFKYLILGLIAIYVALKLTSPFWIAIIGLSCIPVLIIIGRWELRKAAKVEQWVSTEYGSVLKYQDFNIKVKQTELLEEILKELMEANKGH